MKLSILILTLKNRKKHLSNLFRIITKQIVEGVEVLTETDNGETPIGLKRNNILKRSKGEYVVFIDDDDEVSDDYIQKILKAIKTNPDCCSLTGEITIDNGEPEIFEHSIKYSEWKTVEGQVPKYERYPNHLNVIKRDIAIKYDFIPVNHGEDLDWSTRIFRTGDLKTEATIEGVIYKYKFISRK